MTKSKLQDSLVCSILKGNFISMEANQSTYFMSSIITNITERFCPSDPIQDNTPQTGYYIFGAILSIIMGVSIVGNTFVLLAFGKTKSLQRMNNVWYISLAAADLARAILCMPLFICMLILPEWSLPPEMCPFYYSFHASLQTVTIFHLTGISVDRVFVISAPLVYQRVVTRTLMTVTIIGLWIVSFLYGFLQLLWWTGEDDSPPDTSQDLIIEELKTFNSECTFKPSLTFCLLDMVFMSIIPLIIMIAAYAKIFRVVHSQMKRLKRKVSEVWEDSESWSSQERKFSRFPKLITVVSAQESTINTGTVITSSTNRTSSSNMTKSTNITSTSEPSQYSQLNTNTQNGNTESENTGTSKHNDQSVENSCLGLNISSNHFAKSTVEHSHAKNNHEIIIDHTDSSNNYMNKNNNAGHKSDSNPTPIKQRPPKPPPKSRVASTDNNKVFKSKTKHIRTIKTVEEAKYPIQIKRAATDESCQACECPASPTESVSDSEVSQPKINKAKTKKRSFSLPHLSSQPQPILKPIQNMDGISQQSCLKRNKSSLLKNYGDDRSASYGGQLSRRPSVQFHLYTEDEETVTKSNLKNTQSETDKNPAGGTHDSAPKSDDTGLKPKTAKETNVQPSQKHTLVWASRHFNVDQNFSYTSGTPGASVAGESVGSGATWNSRLQRRRRSLQRFKENKAVKMTTAVVGAFILCWLPYQVIYVIKHSCTTCIPPLIWVAMNTLAYCASAINPFIYNFYSSEFRRALRRALCCKDNQIGPWM